MDEYEYQQMPHRRPGLDVPVIDDGIDFSSLARSAVEAYIRQAKDVFVEYFPEGRRPSVTDRSMVLVAHGVSEEVFDRVFLPVNARYLLEDNGDLYIRKVPGRCHAAVHGTIIDDFAYWKSDNGLRRSIVTQPAGSGQYGNTKAEPDVGIHARSDGPASTPRVIIEIEVTHRSTRGSREQAGRYFLNPSVRAVMLIKVWKRRARDDAFAAACVLWMKDGDGNIGCQEAHDFGSRRIHTTARNNFLVEAGPGDHFAPCVPEDTNFVEPQPGRAVAGRTPQIVALPAGLIIANASNENGAMLENTVPPPGNLEIDLSFIAETIEDELPRAQVGDEAGDDE